MISLSDPEVEASDSTKSGCVEIGIGNLMVPIALISTIGCLGYSHFMYARA